MKIEMSLSVYLALCALVKDAMEVESDATQVLHKAARELAVALENLPQDAENETRIAAIAEMRDLANAHQSAA